MNARNLDDLDRRILRRLQDDPTLTGPDLAEAVGATSGRVTRRLERLRETGTLRGMRAEINWAALGYSVTVSLRITIDKSNSRALDELISAAREVAEITEIQTFLGSVDLRLSLVARDLAHYQDLYRNKILTLPHIVELEALMQLATLKNRQTLPL